MKSDGNDDPPPTLDSAVPSQMIPLRAQAGGLPRAFSAFQRRDYRLWFGGQLVSVAGTWMQSVAQQWLVYQLSGSETMLGLVAFAGAIPALLLTPIGGVAVDRFPKRAVLIVTQSTMMLLAFLLAGLAFAQVAEVWHIVALAAGLGAANAFDGPARQSFVVEMVGKRDLPNAIAMNSTMFNLARVIGPALGGAAMTAWGPEWCFLLNGVSFLAVIGALLAMRLPPRERPPGSGSPLAQLAEGLRYARSQPTLGGLIALALIFSLFGLSYSALLPAFVDRALHRGAGDFASILTATGLGAVTGTLTIAAYGESRGRRGQWLALAAFGFPALLLIFANNAVFEIALALAFGLGLGFMFQFTLINTLLQTHVEDAMRGRLMSLYTITFFGLAPLGYLAVGAIAERVGLSLTVSVSALIAAALAALVLARVPAIRKLA